IVAKALAAGLVPADPSATSYPSLPSSRLPVRRPRPSTRVADRRIRALLACFGLVFAITLARAVWLQTVQAGELARRGASQQRETLTVPAARGTIFDR